MNKPRTAEQNGNAWQIERKIPVLFIWAIVAGVIASLLQAGSFIWYASQQDARVTSLEAENAERNVAISRLADDVTMLGKSMVRVETMLENINQKKIDDKPLE